MKEMVINSGHKGLYYVSADLLLVWVVQTFREKQPLLYQILSPPFDLILFTNIGSTKTWVLLQIWVQNTADIKDVEDNT